MPFHTNLKKLRERAGLTQARLAADLGANLRTLQGWEGGRREPRLAHLPALARALGCTTDELLAGLEPAPPTKKKRKAKGRKGR